MAEILNEDQIQVKNFLEMIKEIITYAQGQNRVYKMLEKSLTKGDIIEIMFDIMNKIYNMNPGLIPNFDLHFGGFKYLKIETSKR